MGYGLFDNRHHSYQPMTPEEEEEFRKKHKVLAAYEKASKIRAKIFLTIFAIICIPIVILFILLVIWILGL